MSTSAETIRWDRRIGTAKGNHFRAAMTLGLLVSMAVVLAWSLVLTEVESGSVPANWVAFTVAAGGMLIAERTPAAWIRFGPIGVVTPLWMFAFAMLLLGSPSITAACAAAGATLHALKQDSSVPDTVARVAGTVVSLAAAGLVLRALETPQGISATDSVTWARAGAFGAAGISILGLNAFAAAIWLSARRRSSFISLLRHGLASRVTAEGALLSLAPIWVIGLRLNPVIIPLLALTTILVFRSARQALEQAHEAHHDQLTGLVNRRAFLHQVDDAMESRHRRGVVVLLMDLNGFKAINDRLGHQCGDALLVAFADRLESGRPTDATAARLGGDEFALLVRDPDQTAHAMVEELHARLTQPLTLEGFPLTTGVSIGVATAPHDGTTTTEILQAADVAMYKAKRTGTAFSFYDECVKLPRHGRLNLLTDLSDALVNSQLHLEFQPQIRFADGAVDTLEALVRWNHPQHGRIPPSEFIGLAEQTDLIGSITDLVLRTASGGMVAGEVNTRLAINVAPRSLEDPEFADRVFRTIAETGFPADRLELELTERGLVRNVERSGYAIAKLRSAGVRIAIDDFGVGYSSYQTLRNLEVDRVKIDRDFVQGVLTSDRDRVIVSSLIDLAHDLGLDVVAEGVESSRAWDALAALDCDIAQGYGIAVPMSYTDLRGWLAQWNNVALRGGRSDSLVR